MIPADQEAATPSQLDLFERRLPRRPYCTDDLELGLRIRDPKRASACRYIQANPPWLRSWLLFDLDRSDAAVRWDDVLLPEPAWIAQNRESGRAHLAWGLDAPVLLGQHDRARPMRYLAAVESAMRAKLEADPGYSGLVTKNPAHDDWRVLWGRRMYSLGDLEEWLELPRHTPRRGRDPARIGIGRNVATFDHTRHLAYRQVRDWKRAGGSGVYIEWLSHLYATALDYTHAEHPRPLDYREAHWIAKSVAHWVWTRFDVEASDQRFSARQAARGRRKGADRRGWALPIAVSLADAGWSTREIASDLGIDHSTVVRWFARGGAKP